MPTDDTCSRCRLYSKGDTRNPNLQPVGNSNPDVYIVGESPTENEDLSAKYLVGSTGRLFRRVLVSEYKEGFTTRYYCPINCKHRADSLEGHEIKICGERLREDIRKTRPRSIVCLGALGVRALFPDAPDKANSSHSLRDAVIPYYATATEPPIPVVFLPPMREKESQSPGFNQLWEHKLRAAFSTYRLPDKLPEPRIVECTKFTLLQELFLKLKEEDAVAFDIETVGLVAEEKEGKTSMLYTISFAFDDNTVYAVPLYEGYWPENIHTALYSALEKWLTSFPDQIKIAHNMKFELQWLLKKVCGVRTTKVLQGQYHDSQLLAWVLDELQGNSALKLAVFRVFGVPDWGLSDKEITDVRLVPLTKLLQYNALDSFYTYHLYWWVRNLVNENKTFCSLYADLLIPATFAFLETELSGVPVDLTELDDLTTSVTATVNSALADIRALTGNPTISPGSSDQLIKYFTKSQNYEIPYKTPGGKISVNKESLEYIAHEYADKVAARVLDHRKSSKILSTYLKGLDKQVYKDGSMYPSYNLTGTVTGRTSCSDPNMQNFPKRESKEVRRVVAAPAGHVIAAFDYGQSEARLFGIMTGDPEFCRLLEEGYDIHLDNSKRLFGEKDAAKFRGPVKNSTFALLYGSSPQTAARAAGTSVESMEALRDLVFQRFPRFREWQVSMVTQEKSTGYVESLFGRRRRSPMRYNELLNHATQSTSSDLTLYSMIYLYKKYRILTMIHDDITFLLPDDDSLQGAIEEITRAMLVLPWVLMSKHALCNRWVPLQVECEVGPNWADLAPVYTLDSIAAGYGSLEKSLDEASKMQALLSE